MTLVTLRPDSTTSNTGALVGGATAHAILSDNSDASYVEHDFNEITKVGVADLTLPAGAVMKTVTIRVRIACSAGTGYYFVTGGTTAVPPATSFTTLTSVNATITTRSTGTRTDWTDADVDGAYINVAALDPGDGVARLYEAYFDARYVILPVVTVVLPTGTITNTNTPTVTWTSVRDADGGSQDSFEVKIFSAAQYGAGGFSADTSTPTATSGIVAGGAETWDDTVILPDAVYRAYVRISQTVNGSSFWSAWAFGAFTVSVALPAVPTVVLTADSTNGRVKVDLGVSNLIPNPSLETNTTGWASSATGLTAGSTLTQDATVHQSGTKSLKIVTTAVASTQGAAAALPELEAGVPYTLSAYIKGNAGAEPLSIAILTSAGATLPTSSGSAILTPLSPAVTTTLQRYTLTFTPSANATGANFITYDNTAAVRTWFIDAVMLASNTTVAPTYADGGPATTDRLELQRSIDAGVTWVPVRNTDGDDGLVLATGAIIYDYEAPNGTATQYRARALHSYTGIYAASAWSTPLSVTWTATDWWIKHPNLPALNLKLTVGMFSYADVQHAARQGIFQPLGAELPIVVSDTRGGATGTVTLLLATAALQDALDALLDTADTFLLQGPLADGQPDRYVRFGDHASVRLVDRSWAKATTEALAWIEVAQPTGATA
jgi:hypothetical protein